MTKVSVFFFPLRLNRSYFGMHASIKLKFGTHVGKPKAIINSKFGDDWTKILVVMNDHCHIQRSIC